MNRAILALCLALALAGCETNPGPAFMHDAPITAPLVEKPVTAPPPKPACAPFHEWSEADLNTLAGTLEAIPPASIIIRMALDWRRYYGDAKACPAKQK